MNGFVTALKHMRRTKENTITNAEIANNRLIVRRFDGSTFVFGNDTPVINPTEGVPLTLYGHSFAVDPPLVASPGGSYASRVKSRNLMGVVSSHAVSGHVMQQTAFEIVGHSSPWTPGDKGVVLVDAVINNAAQGDTAKGRAGFQNSLRALLHRLSVESIVESSSGDFVKKTPGSWFSADGADYSSGSTIGTVDSDEYLDVTFSGDKVVIFHFAVDDTTWATYDFKSGSTVLASHDPNNGTITYSGQTLSPVAHLFTGFGAGSHTIRIEATSPGFWAIDALGIPSDTPPAIGILKGTPYLDETWAGNDGSDEILAIYNELIDPIVEEFPHASVIDPNPDWVKSMMVGSDGAHPNDLGMKHYADAISSWFNTLSFRDGLNIL